MKISYGKFYTTSSLTIIGVDDYSTVRYEKNFYSVPVKYLRKDVTVKGYGNYLSILYQNTEIANYIRCYFSGKTEYRLEHYIDLLERKPRSVFNAKPVKSNVTGTLLDWGRQLPGGNREMVKLLRLCVDYGEDRILSIKNLIPSHIVPTVDMVRTHLNEPTESPVIYLTSKEVTVEPVDLTAYDKKYGMVVQ